jgi:hypothetical protein
MGMRKHRWRPAAWIAGIVFVGLMPCCGAVDAATIVALGASNTLWQRRVAQRGLSGTT